MEKPSCVPRHVAIIMDGNGRWAKKRLLPRKAGHSAGMNNLKKLLQGAMKQGIKYFTVYALSTENMSRPKEELEALYDLLRRYFKENLPEVQKRGVRVKVIGDITALPQDIQELIQSVESQSAGNSSFTFTIALNYGGRAEITRAANLVRQKGVDVSEEEFSKYLYTYDLPDPDLIIRTGGETRISNFLLWQSAYSEYYFTNVYFPDFDDKQLSKALEDFSKRDRRYGQVQS